MIELMFDRDRAVTDIEAGQCPCGDCRGDLTVAALSRGNWRFCRVYRCAWKVSVIDGQTCATAIHTASHVPKPKGTDLRPP
jgi:hypothetical protein